MSLAIPSNFANAVAPFVPAGRQPVGQENEDLRSSTLKPLEQLPESARRENRRGPDERANEDGERQRLSGSGGVYRPDGSVAADDGSPAETGAARPSPEVVPGESSARERERIREVEEQAEIRELAARDREVRIHEQAHAAIGGRHAGAPQYQYERGPDGVSYAVAGEVPIDTSPIPNDPRATIEKAQQIRRAAFAPLEPSDTDRRVAAEAARMEAEARAELRQEELEASSAGEDERSREAAEPSRSLQDVEREDTERQDSQERQKQLRQRNLDTYRQLIDLGTLGDRVPLGGRLDQRI